MVCDTVETEREKNKKTMPRVSPKISSALNTLFWIAEEVGWVFSPKGSLAGIGMSHDTWVVVSAGREKFFIAQEKRRRLYYLRRRKLIESRHVGERLELKLTDKGFWVLLKELVRRTALNKDGKLCIVSYDVPQSEKRLRQMLRRLLRHCGFTRLQQSVWMIPKDVSSLFQAFVTESKLSQWIQVIEGRII